MSALDLAWTVGEASLRASVALAGALALRRALVRSGADVRRVLLLSAVLAVPLLPFAVSVLPGFAVVARAPEALPAIADRAGVPAGGEAGAGAMTTALLPTLLEVAALVWVAGAGLMLLRLGAGLATAARQARQAVPVADPDWLGTRDAMAARLGIRRTPDLRMATREIVPRAWGVFRPVVLVPPSALAWDEERRRAILAHEIAHLVRREPLTRIAAEAVRAIHWFDPLLRAAVARARRESELAADEAAVAAGIEPADYAATLVALARERRAPAPCRAVASFASTSEVGWRVETILSAKRGGRGTAPGSSTLARTTALLALAAVTLTSLPRLAGESLTAIQAARFGISEPLAGQILDAARREGLDPALAFGLVAEESRFDPDRVSEAGAVGLTQILPATARRIEPGLDPADLRAVPVNLRIGLRYLRTRIEAEGGDVREGLLAYAVGPGRLAELRAAGAPVLSDYPDRVLGHLD